MLIVNSKFLPGNNFLAYIAWVFCLLFYVWWLLISMKKDWHIPIKFYFTYKYLLLYILWLQDSVIKPITKILFGVAVIALLISFVWKENPQWMEKLNIKGNFPPWVLACVVIVFTRMRKRTGDFLKKYGWWADATNAIFMTAKKLHYLPKFCQERL